MEGLHCCLQVMQCLLENGSARRSLGCHFGSATSSTYLPLCDNPCDGRNRSHIMLALHGHVRARPW